MENTLIERLKSRLESQGKSAREVSMAATGTTDAVRNILRGATRNPKAVTLERIAAELDTTVAWLLGDSDEAARPPDAPAPPPIANTSPADVSLPTRHQLPNDVPVHGTAAASHLRGAFQLEPGIIDYVRRPPGLASARDAYALYVEGSSMEPRYAPGDLVFIHPHRPPRLGDTVIVQVQVMPGEIEASIGVLHRRTAEHVILGKLNPEAEVRLNRAQVTAIHRVLSVNDLFGV